MNWSIHRSFLDGPIGNKITQLGIREQSRKPLPVGIRSRPYSRVWPRRGVSPKLQRRRKLARSRERISTHLGAAALLLPAKTPANAVYVLARQLTVRLPDPGSRNLG